MLTDAVPASVVALLIGALFHWQGNASNVAMEGRSLFLWVAHQWLLAGGAFSHGWLMPLVSLGFVWQSRRALAEAPKEVFRPGFVLVLLCLLAHWAGLRAQQPRLSLIAFAGLLWSVPLFLYGRRVARLLLFPFGYLLLCFMSYYLDTLTFRLRLIAGAISTTMLNGVGIASHRLGTAVFTAAGGGFQFDVADPCSGLRSLVVMVALSAPYAYLTQTTLVRKWVLFAASVPLAMAANVVRIVTIALAAEFVSPSFAMTLYHDYSGFIVFAAAAALLAGVGRLLQTHPREALHRWLTHA